MSRGTRAVAAGILASRLAGLARDRVTAVLLGVGPHADVVRLALRAPNLLQNLLGEQALSASFIPVYSRLLAAGRREDAARLAGAVFGLLAVAAGALAVAGVLLAPWIVRLFAPGLLADAAAVAAGEATFDRLPLAVEAVRIVFPMTALLVLSAWALGVLNSHRRFLLPYAAPVLWNAAIVAALVGVGMETGALEAPSLADASTLSRLVLAAAWGALLGGALQLAVQIPAVLRLLGRFRPLPRLDAPGLGETWAAFLPALAGRGVAQVSSYLDLVLASFLHAGAVAALGWAATLALLPISLFGMAVAAAELPELSTEGRETDPAARARVAARVEAGLVQGAFVVAPTTLGYLVFGFLVAGLIYGGGRFSAADNWLVYLALGGYSLGLLPTTAGRLLQNTFFAIGDTRTPARIAGVRLAVSATLGAGAMLALDRVPLAAVAGAGASAAPLFLGAVGLAVASGLAGWCELALLARALRRSFPELRLPVAAIGQRLLAAAAAALPASLVWVAIRGAPLAVQALVVLPVFAACYLGLAAWRRDPALARWIGGAPARVETTSGGGESRDPGSDGPV